MGFSYHKTKDDYFITIDGKPFTDYDPKDVSTLINSLPPDELELVTGMTKNKLYDMYEEMTGVPLTNNYAEHVGRPNLDKLPFMKSENDGYPYLPGHSPICNGKEYHRGMCKCKYNEWNTTDGRVTSASEMWPGGPNIDDFDM